MLAFDVFIFTRYYNFGLYISLLVIEAENIILPCLSLNNEHYIFNVLSVWKSGCNPVTGIAWKEQKEGAKKLSLARGLRGYEVLVPIRIRHVARHNFLL